MSLVIFENFLESLQLSIVHCLDDKPRIVREEKEAATLTLRLSGFFYFLDIFIRVEGLLDHVGVNIVGYSDLAKDSTSKLMNDNLLENFPLDYSSIVSRLWWCLRKSSICSNWVVYCLIVILRYVENTHLVIELVFLCFHCFIIAILVVLVLRQTAPIFSAFRVPAIPLVVGLKCVCDFDVW